LMPHERKTPRWTRAFTFFFFCFDDDGDDDVLLELSRTIQCTIHERYSFLLYDSSTASASALLSTTTRRSDQPIISDHARIQTPMLSYTYLSPAQKRGLALYIDDVWIRTAGSRVNIFQAFNIPVVSRAEYPLWLRCCPFLSATCSLSRLSLDEY
jgi:hypothetical protein